MWDKIKIKISVALFWYRPLDGRKKTQETLSVLYSLSLLPAAPKATRVAAYLPPPRL
jgi:hypothetical protein